MKTTSDFAPKGFQVTERECIWMKAGVINFRLCDRVYDCSHCPFDKVMQRAMGDLQEHGQKKEAADWVLQLQKKYAGADRPCRHYLTGRTDAPKICVLNYECYHCAYDQMLDECDEHQLSQRPHCFLAGGFDLARDYYYHTGHSWIRVEHGGRVRVGLDDFAVSLFGPSRQLELPPLGAAVQQDSVGWTFRRDNRWAAVLSPISGTVLVVNHSVREHPEILYKDPYHAGWLFMVEPTRSKKELKQLYFDEQSRQWMESETQRLMGMMGREYEQLSALAGHAVRDIVGAYTHLDWTDLSKRFLRTEGV